jgi:protein dithiol:quinone oxidoreductase
MVVKILNTLINSPTYWLACLVGGVTALLVALLYQYVFDEWPCVLCIHIRLWITLLVIVSIAGLLVRKFKILNLFTHFSLVLVAIGLTERSYMLLGTERGFVFGDCGFDVGLPAWFAIESWIPWMYRVESSCGYTPELVLGITMAEALMVMSVGLLILSTAVLAAAVIGLKNNYKT